MRARLLAAAFATASLAACWFDAFEGFSGGADGDGGTADGASDAPITSTDGGGTGTDGGGEVDSSAVGCTGVDAAFCADFETPLPSGFTSVETYGGGTVDLGTDFARSPAHSMKVVIPLTDAGSGAYVEAPFPAVATKITLALSMRFVARGSASFDTTQIRWGDYWIQLDCGSDGVIDLVERRPLPDGGLIGQATRAAGAYTIATNEWHRYQLVVNLTTKHADVTVDGTAYAAKDLPNTFSFADAKRLLLVGDIFVDVNSSRWDLRYDDVMLFVE